MHRSIFVAIIVVIGLSFSLTADAVIKGPKSPYQPPSKLPAEIHGLRYIAGLTAIDSKKYPGDYRPVVWAELSKKDFALRRQRIDQTTLNKKARKLEKIDLVRIPYKKIDEVWYGEEAIKKLAVTNLPTVPRNVWNFRSGSYDPIEVFLDQRYRSPVVVIYRKGRKKRASLIVMGSNEKSAALYGLLIRHTRNRRKK